MFNIETYRQYLTTQWLGRQIEVFDELPSTNSYLKDEGNRAKHISSVLCEGLLILAEHQTAGRGQRNRVWQTKPGENLTFSFCFHPHQLKRLPSLTLLVAVACAEAIEKLIKIPIDIKWPNDLFADGRKISGILIESALLGNKVENLVVGIGLNVNQTEFTDATSTATSLRNVLPDGVEMPSREKILAVICNTLEPHLDAWDSGEALPREASHKRLVGYGFYGNIEINDVIQDDMVKFMGIDSEGYPTFVSYDGDIIRYRHEQIRFHPETISVM